MDGVILTREQARQVMVALLGSVMTLREVKKQLPGPLHRARAGAAAEAITTLAGAMNLPTGDQP